MRIFIPEKRNSLDISDAYNHGGDVTFLADRLPDASQDPTRFFEEAVSAIKDSGFSQEDHLCMSGYPTNLAVLLSAFVHLGFTEINLLLFNFKSSSYYKRKMFIQEATNEPRS